MKFALIGHPVAGSVSPVLFSAAYGGKHAYDLVDGGFEECWGAFLESYDGINVTAPYKQDAFERCSWLSPAALRTGAVNLVLRDGLLGYNTDVDGVLYALRGECFERVLVVGTGGAARAAIEAALQLGCQVSVWGRSAEKVSALEKHFGLGPAPVNPDLIIYTLPGSAPVPDGLPFSNAVVLEAEYRIPQLCHVPCKRYIHGLNWLLGQAMAGYSLFTGEEPSSAAMETAMEQFLQ